VTLELVRTARLTCERLRAEHADELTRLLCDPRIAAALSPSGVLPTADAVLVYLESKIEHWDRFGFGMWLVRDRVSGEMVGRGGLQHAYVAGLHEVEAGWAIIPERWGRGLATELAVTSVEAAFEQLRLQRLIAYARTDNHASRRVMEKTGFAYEREIEHEGLAHALYRQGRPVRQRPS
jgi:ribosomal-protein-alanine N-acetyltransferase